MEGRARKEVKPLDAWVNGNLESYLFKIKLDYEVIVEISERLLSGYGRRDTEKKARLGGKSGFDPFEVQQGGEASLQAGGNTNIQCECVKLEKLPDK